MESKETYYEVEADYVAKSAYDTEIPTKRKSVRLHSIEEVNAWIEENKRTVVTCGMGDVDFPKMSKCTIFEHTVITKQTEVDLNEIFVIENDDF